MSDAPREPMIVQTARRLMDQTTLDYTPFRDQRNIQAGLNEFDKIVSHAISPFAYLYRLQDLTDFSRIFNGLVEDTFNELIRDKKKSWVERKISTEELREMFARNFKEHLEDEKHSDPINIGKIEPFIDFWLRKITDVFFSTLKVEGTLDEVMRQAKIVSHGIVESIFFRTTELFGRELSKQELQRIGAVYSPVISPGTKEEVNVHGWTVNYMWVLAHAIKGTNFVILCDFNEETCRCTTAHALGHKSAFAHELCALLKAGYILHIENGVTVRLTPPPLQPAPPAASPASGGPSSPAAAAAGAGAGSSPSLSASPDLMPGSSLNPRIHMEENDGIKGHGINPTEEEIQRIFEQIQALKARHPGHHNNFSCCLQDGRLIEVSPSGEPVASSLLTDRLAAAERALGSRGEGAIDETHRTLTLARDAGVLPPAAGPVGSPAFPVAPPPPPPPASSITSPAVGPAPP